LIYNLKPGVDIFSWGGADQALPLELLPGWEESALLGEAAARDSVLLEEMTSLPVTINFHHWCLTRENFTRYGLDKEWRALSVNTDQEGLEFISAMEHKSLPFFGTQFHPEKNAFEWAVQYPNIPHSRAAVEVAQFFAQFFLSLARQSEHKFSTREEEESALIYNFIPFYSGKSGRDSGFQQVYLFGGK